MRYSSTSYNDRYEKFANPFINPVTGTQFTLYIQSAKLIHFRQITNKSRKSFQPYSV